MRRITLAVCLLAAAAVARQDIGISAILAPDTVHWEPLSSTMRMLFRVHNYGDERVTSLPYGLWLDSAGVRVAENRFRWDEPLDPGGDYDGWTWAEWPGYGNLAHCYIDLTAFTNLDRDFDRRNDTMRLRFWYSSGTIGDTMPAHDYCHVGSVDGIINPEEFVFHTDISDFAGRAGNRRPRASVLVFAGYGVRAWFGVDVSTLTDRQDGDRVLLYCDISGDRQWDPDSGEGLFAVEVRNGVDSVFYTPMPGGSPEPCSGAVAASSAASGHLQFEIGWPFNGNHWWPSMGACSFWRGDSCWGWWPPSLDTADWFDPTLYGVIDWVTFAVEEGPEAARPARRLPTVLRAPGLVRWDGRVLDIQGRDVTDRRQALSPGVYFCRPATGSTSFSRRVILTR